MRWSRFAAVALLVACVTLMLTGSTSANRKFTLRLPWIINSQFAGVYVALDKGFFAEEGIDLEVRPGGIDKNSITLVAAGADDFGLHDAGSLIMARRQGMPLKAVAAFFQKHPGGLMMLKSSGITQPKDLIGKRLGYQEGGPFTLVKAMFEKEGVPLNKVKLVSVKYDISPLLTGQIDAMTVYVTSEPVTAEEKGFEVTTILPYDYGIKTFSEVLFTRDKIIAEHPDVVRGMVRALRRGWEYAINNREEAIEILSKYDKTIDKKREMGQLVREIPLMITEDTKKHGLGFMSREGWSQVQEIFYAQGQLDKKIDIDTVFTTEFLGLK